MDRLWLAFLIGFPLIWHLALTIYVYQDAPSYGLNPTKWGLISLLIPLFGFFAYMFARDEKTMEEPTELFGDGPFEIHRSRANEPPDHVRSSDDGDDTDRGEN